jgi:hypothetical protein
MFAIGYGHDEAEQVGQSLGQCSFRLSLNGGMLICYSVPVIVGVNPNDTTVEPMSIALSTTFMHFPLFHT